MMIGVLVSEVREPGAATADRNPPT